MTLQYATRPMLPVDLVIDRYCALTRTQKYVLISSARTREITRRRGEAFWLCRYLTSAPLRELTEVFGRDAASLLSLLDRVVERISADAEYRTWINDLVAMICGPEGATPSPLTIIAARGVLADPNLTDADARTAALSLLSQPTHQPLI